MDIGKKIEEVFGQMKQRPMLMDKFYELESMEQVYEFFHSIRGGYTKQEFYDYISNSFFYHPVPIIGRRDGKIKQKCGKKRLDGK